MNRYDFVYIFDAKDANPNGDPDAGNLPRVDPETGHGLVTDVCLKRKVRNYVAMTRGNQPPDEIYFSDRAVLNRAHTRAYESIGEKPRPSKLPKDADKARQLTAFMCHNFYDIRTFGAVMAMEVNCGQVRGPAALTQPSARPKTGGSTSRFVPSHAAVAPGGRRAIWTNAPALPQGDRLRRDDIDVRVGR